MANHSSHLGDPNKRNEGLDLPHWPLQTAQPWPQIHEMANEKTYRLTHEHLPW